VGLVSAERAMNRTGLDSLCAHLANRGLVVVAYVVRKESVVLMFSGGAEVEIALRRLGERLDMVGDAIASELDPYRLKVVGTYELPVEVSERTLSWWRFLRWWCKKGEHVHAPPAKT
jgi:hypothetical protein